MNEDDLWIYCDGPAPPHVRQFLDALLGLPPLTPEDEERIDDTFFEKLDALAARKKAERRALRAEAAQPSSDAPRLGGAWPEAAPEAAPEAWPEAAPRIAEGGVTVRSPIVEDRRGAPVVEPSPPAPPAPPVAAREPAPEIPGARAPGSLVSTAMAIELPPELREQQGRLPFRPVQPGEVPAWRTIAKTNVLPVMGLEPGQTAGLEDSDVARAARALPFVVNRAGRTVPPFPRLTRQRFAALQAELTVRPEERAEIFPRYQVTNDPGYISLVEDWGLLFAEKPAERAAFDEAYGQFVTYMRGHKG